MEGVQVVESLCGARRRSKDGGTCRRPAGWGTPHLGTGRCRVHGGSTPNHLIAAARVQLSELVTWIDVPDPLPHEALLWCVRLAAGQVDYATRQVHALAEDQALVAGRLHPWIVVRAEAMDLLARASKMAIDAKVDERRVQATERYGKQIADAVSGALEEIELTEAQQALLPSVLRRHFLAAGEAKTTERT